MLYFSANPAVAALLKTMEACKTGSGVATAVESLLFEVDRFRTALQEVILTTPAKKPEGI